MIKIEIHILQSHERFTFLMHLLAKEYSIEMNIQCFWVCLQIVLCVCVRVRVCWGAGPWEC